MGETVRYHDGSREPVKLRLWKGTLSLMTWLVTRNVASYTMYYIHTIKRVYHKYLICRYAVKRQLNPIGASSKPYLHELQKRR